MSDVDPILTQAPAARRPSPSRRKITAIPVLAVVACLLPIAGCDRFFPSLPSDDAPIVMILGDSITAGKTLDKSLHYPALLEAKFTADRIDVRIYNGGYPGEDSTSAERRAVESLGFHPAMIVIALGTNDITGDNTPEQSEKNLADAITAMQTRGVPVFLVGSLVERASEERLAAYAQVYRRLAKRFDVPLVPDILSPVSNKPGLIRDDNIHPTAAGQVAIADMLYEPLKKWVVEEIAKRRAARAAAQN